MSRFFDGPGVHRDHAGRTLVADAGQHFEVDDLDRLVVVDDTVPPVLIGSTWHPRKGVDVPAVRIVGVQHFAQVGGGSRVELVVQSLDGTPLLDRYEDEVLSLSVDAETLAQNWTRDAAASAAALKAIDAVRDRLVGMGG
jgi:hypothetical protein